MGVKFSPVGNGVNWIPNTGLIANGYKLFFYETGTTTKKNTYTTSVGNVANANPVVLDTYGFPSSGGSRVEIWLTEGESYKVVIASGSDTDPPASGITLADGITGVNDGGDNVSEEWNLSGLTPTYVSATSFTVAGDYTSLFHVGRRLKSTVTGGTAYSTITATSYSAPNTTVTVVNDSTTLDSGLSAVYYGILSSVNPAIPKIALPDGSTATTQSARDNSTKIATTAYVDAKDPSSPMDFRLSLTSGTPVTTADVTGATTVYMTPFKGNRISLYNGTKWITYSTAEISVSLGTITNDQGYDVFCYANGSTPTLELLAWTNNTTRATALAYQDGVLCKTGQLTRRYIGSFLTTSTTTTEDSNDKRYLFNYYNRMPRRMRRLESTATWLYNTATFRQANNSASNQLNLFIGVLDQFVPATLVTNASNSGSGNRAACAIGLNSTSSPAGITAAQTSAAGNKVFSMTCTERLLPVLGKNYISWLEYGDTGGTLTWIGVSSPDQSGITGELQA